MNKSWAEECAERHWKIGGYRPGHRPAIEAAIREALEKAITVLAEDPHCDQHDYEDCSHVCGIRALLAVTP